MDWMCHNFWDAAKTELKREILAFKFVSKKRRVWFSSQCTKITQFFFHKISLTLCTLIGVKVSGPQELES